MLSKLLKQTTKIGIIGVMVSILLGMTVYGVEAHTLTLLSNEPTCRIEYNLTNYASGDTLEFAEGTEVRLYARAGEGFLFDEASSEDVEIEETGSIGRRFFMPNKDVTVLFNFEEGPATIVGSSIYRQGEEATVKFYSNKAGTYYFCVTDSSVVPSKSDIKAGTIDGIGGYDGATVGTNTISLDGLSTGMQYVYIFVDNGNDSNLIIMEMPYDIYYLENFEAYPIDSYISSGALSPMSQIHDGTGSANQKVVASITDGKMLSLSSSGSWASDQIIKWDSMVPTTGVYVFEGDVSTTYSSDEIGSWLARFTMTNGNYGSPNREMGVHFKDTVIREATKEEIALKDSFTKNTWYHIKIEAFPENNMVFVYINGEKFGPFEIPSGIDRMAITAGHGYTAYYDNLVYYADPSLEVPIMRKLVVNNGTSDADTVVEEDTTVTITADEPPAGLVFYRWNVISGDIALEDANSAETTFTMGTENVEVTAEYKAVIIGQLVYELSDTYGDGWNGNEIRIIDTSGDRVVETLTIESGSSNNGITENLEMGHVYHLYWNHGSYPGEANFKLKSESGNILFEGYGNVNLTESGIFLVVEVGETGDIEEETYTAKIAAVDIADGEEIEGATLQLLDSENNVIKEWVSTFDAEEITGLSGDAEYTLKVTVAPDGYTIPTEITVAIDDAGTITSTGSIRIDGDDKILLVEFAMTHVEILTVNASDFSALSGATVQMVDSEGNVVDEWSSSSDNHIIEGFLTGEEYTLRVTVVPNEEVYEIPSETVFTMATDGTITYTGDSTDAGVLYVSIPEKKVTTYTVTLDANGGTVTPTSKEVTENGTYGELPTPTNEKDVTFLGWYQQKIVHDDTRCFNDTTVPGWVVRATPAEDMNHHNSGVHYFKPGDLLVFDITIDGLENEVEIDRVDVNDDYLSESDYVISDDKQNVRGYTTITEDQYGYVLDFIDVEVTGQVDYTINEFALYHGLVTAESSITNSNHTLIAAWNTEAYEAEIQTVDEINVTLEIPNAGTVVTVEGEYSSEYKSTQAPKPSVTVPSNVNYIVAQYDYFGDISDATFWYVDSEATELFSGEMLAGETYYADLWFEPNEGYIISEDVTMIVNSENIPASTDGTGAFRAIVPVTIPEEESTVFTVAFNSDGGSEVASQEVASGEKATKPKNPTKKGYTFKEWQKDGAKFDFKTPITENMELKAIWTVRTSTGGGSSSTSSYKITTKIENGTITPENISVEKNEDQEFTFKVDDGYEITDVLVDGKSVGVVTSYKLEKVTEKHTIEVKTAKVEAFNNVDDWAKEEMEKAIEMGLVPETFSKKDATKPITRLDFAAVAVKLYEALTGKKAEPAKENPFTDTGDEYVLKAYALGITKGTSKTTFTPKTEITREQMATMLTRAFAKAGINTEIDITNITRFADDSDLSDWGRPSVYFMEKEEIIKGIGNNLFNGLGNAKVEEAIAIVLRSVEVFAK